jgi:hypothetical protein
MKQTFIQQLIGTEDIVQFSVSFTLALIGAFIMLRYEASARDKHSPNTPYGFDIKFLVKDNVLRLANTLALIFVGIRFSNMIFGGEVTFYTALVIGASLDKVSQFLKNLSSKARK